jgi:hypothetical protein
MAGVIGHLGELSMSRKNVIKGVRGIPVEFAGKSRIMRMTHGGIGEFALAANNHLHEIGAVRDTWLLPNGLVPGWLGETHVMSLALFSQSRHRIN